MEQTFVLPPPRHKACSEASCQGSPSSSTPDVVLGLDERLIRAATEGCCSVVALLLEQGADVHYRNDLALARALLGAHTVCVKLLMERGARCEGLVLSCALERGEERGGEWEACAALLSSRGR